MTLPEFHHVHNKLLRDWRAEMPIKHRQHADKLHDAFPARIDALKAQVEAMERGPDHAMAEQQLKITTDGIHGHIHHHRSRLHQAEILAAIHSK